ncbi:competence protein ComEC [Psychrobacter sp. Sarcosine-02u-2]|uniref:ComEC/Rec2 family competence protein n=1 Tax=Psychrobacter sp. Sarcosine-02u-2 TaxID=2058324 RepID=UPI000C7C1EBF|nr:ComEC/Rec2 family competence protein [Psychrobacter sp. Sarcosine-02u-2]PKG86929.1 competence protein ComEC [Psychrobacter sp. Sarcosine-02u-2]
MYWLIGSLIIIVMMGVLAVADTMPLPVGSLLPDLSTSSILPLLLIALTIVLVFINQRYIAFSPSIDAKKRYVKNSSAQNFAVQNAAKTPSSTSSLLYKFAHHLLMAVLAVALISGSGLLALINQQQAQSNAIKQTVRVQALVSIEGISDSVYDDASNSGYRQVATISHISPLLSELTSQGLDKLSVNYNANYREDVNNSLSNKENNLNGDNFEYFENKQYRILLNAYPKKSFSKKPLPKKPSKKGTENKSQTIELNHLQPGDQLLMTLMLAPLANSEQALNNPTGFDSYRWLRGRHIDGVATILATSTSTILFNGSAALSEADNSYLYRFRNAIDQGRWQLRQHFYQDWAGQTLAEQQAKAVTLSLLTGDRSLINRDTKDLYQLAGISHLLAISGTHVLFLAIVLAGLAVLLLNRFYPSIYRHIPRWQLRWWVMMSAAFIYALFTGFDVPAARTAWMLLAIGLIRLTLLPISTMRILLALAVLMAWFDPYVLWQAGYWLSFIAVALLLKYEDSSVSWSQTESASLTTTNSNDNKNAKILQRTWLGFKRLFKLQFWLFIALLPITLLLFGKASLLGFIVNLFAIGLFGWVIVPLNLLAGLCYLIVPTLADAIWTLVIALVAYLHELITWLTALPIFSGAWLYTPVNMAILLMVLLAMLPWLLPRGLISRWLALAPLTLLVMTVYANQQSLTMTPTLYILPTGDQYLSAAVLQYPVLNNEVNKTNVSWLILADHRPYDTRTMPSTLTADKLSATLEQQLRSLSITRLEGMVVQSSSAALTTSLATLTNNNRKSLPTIYKPNGSELLPMTVAELSQRLPTAQYWQAGRSERWPELQRAYQLASQSGKNRTHATISAQVCEQGKTWQLANGDLTLQALTGWSKINDASVWDCTLELDSRLPIHVINYNAADPLKSLATKVQTLQSDNKVTPSQIKNAQSRLVLNADTHPRVWQMWSLLCAIEPNTKNDTLKNSLNNTLGNVINSTTWLGHSASHISTEVITQQQIHETITYDNKPLDAALAFEADSKD